MRLALAFQRWDIEGLKDEMDAQQWARWLEYFAIEPEGWQSIRLMTQRLTYSVLKSNGAKVKYKDCDLNLQSSKGQYSPEVEKMRWEAMAISQSIREGLVRNG